VAFHSPKILSCCAGAAGLELGLKLALPAARTVCYIEREAYAAAILAARMEEKILDEAPIWSDVRTFDSRPWRKTVDIVTAGYPCQPFSLCGRRQAAKDERHLWPSIRQIIKETKPKFCFLENVPNHLRLGFEQVHDDLRSMGFGVKASLFTAAEVGAPHKRERLFILAHAKGAENWLADVGNRDKPGLERQLPEQQSAHQFRAWPPGPTEHERWRSIPASFKPALHRMDHRMADRMDRIHTCGNGVVPLVAAYAWRVLTACIGPAKA
jgi:DNA (cytosine-5)-methyltransferase 1